MHPALRQGPHFYKNIPHCPPFFTKKTPLFHFLPTGQEWEGIFCGNENRFSDRLGNDNKI